MEMRGWYRGGRARELRGGNYNQQEKANVGGARGRRGEKNNKGEGAAQKNRSSMAALKKTQIPATPQQSYRLQQTTGPSTSPSHARAAPRAAGS